MTNDELLQEILNLKAEYPKIVLSYMYRYNMGLDGHPQILEEMKRAVLRVKEVFSKPTATTGYPELLRACRYALDCIEGTERDYSNRLVALLQAALDTAEHAQHRSDCALHNEPALPIRPCDCGLRLPTRY